MSAEIPVCRDYFVLGHGIFQKLDLRRHQSGLRYVCQSPLSLPLGEVVVEDTLEDSTFTAI